MDEHLLGKLRETTAEARARQHDEEQAAAVLAAIEKQGISLKKFLDTMVPLTRDEIIANLTADAMDVTFETHIGDRDKAMATYEVRLGFFNSDGSSHISTAECRRKVRYQTALRDRLVSYFTEEGFEVTMADSVTPITGGSKPEDEGYYSSGTNYDISLTLNWAAIMATDQFAEIPK